MKKLMFFVIMSVLAGVLALGSAEQAMAGGGYSTTESGNWSTVTWLGWSGENPPDPLPPPNGPGAGDYANLGADVTYDSAASGEIAGLYIGYGMPPASLTVKRSLTVTTDINWQCGTLNVDATTLTINTYAFAKVTSASNGAVIDVASVYMPYNTTTLDNTSQLIIGSNLEARHESETALVFNGASVTVAGDLTFNDGWMPGSINVIQNPGQTTGMTVNGALDLIHDYGEPGGPRKEILNLTFDSGAGAGDWIFRLAQGSDSMTALVASGSITVSGASYEIVNDGTYTTIQATGGGGGAVPEPAGLGLIGAALLVLKRRRS